MKVWEIGQGFTVESEASRYFSKRMEKDKELAGVVEKIRGELKI